MPSRSEANRRRHHPPPPSLLAFLAAAAAIVALVALARPASAAERTAADIVLVDAGTVIDDDFYAAGNQIIVEGRIDGDLIASAFTDIVVSGSVGGDVMAMGGSVAVPGRVEGSVRAVAPTVTVGGTVGGDVVLVAWTGSVDGDVGGDVLAWGSRVELGGTVGGDVDGQAGTLSLSGVVEGGVDVTVDRLEVEAGTVVRGDLGYRSPEPSEEVALAEVGGTVVHRRPLAPNVRVRASFILAKVLLGLMTAVVGLLVMWAAPDPARRAASVVRESPVRSWLVGLAVSASPLVVLAAAGALLAFTPAQAALPVLAVMAPVFLAAVGLVLALALAAPVAVNPVLGDLRRVGRSPVRAFLYGAGILVVASLIPYVVLVVLAVVVPLGVGAWLRLGRAAPA